MDTSIFRHFSNIDTKEIAPGFFSKLIHTDTNTINFIEVAAGCTVPDHSHVHEQLSFVIEGQFQLTVGGIPQILDSGMFAVIPSNAVHNGLAITNCKLIDVFSPVRQDYKQL
ncbi:cupin domain-containing protein [Inquilinus sp. KBS0705]|nr:cupin domain-containing protein [Inquilinus sp. KBS0705]